MLGSARHSASSQHTASFTHHDVVPTVLSSIQRTRLWSGHRARLDVRCPIHTNAAAGDAGFASQPEKEYKPFPRMHEGNPYRLLGLQKDATFEQVQEARNYLYEEYRWHEPSREAIELAFESILSKSFKGRRKHGFKPPRTGRRTDVLVDNDRDRMTLQRRFMDLFDPTISMTTLINEGVIYVALGLWALFSSDQSFPLAGAFAYSVYKYQNKRQKALPDGPHFGGNPIIGALLTTLVNIGVACAAMALITAPLQSVLEASMRQVGAFLVITVAGVLSVYVK